VDENKDEWMIEAHYKNSKVLQLWAADGQATFMKAYQIESIPRFMLLGPKGQIIDANLPPPSDPEFERILLKEIPSLAYRNL
jgi:hypothetical protein